MTTETAAQNQADASTAFLRAARAGHLDKILNLINQDIDINVSNANGLNAIHLASKDGHVTVVSELLQRGAHIDSATKKGNTALHIASLAGQEAVVRLLVQNGAQVNIQSQNGFTPLYMAAQENHDGVVKFLLSSGANQSLATEDGFTPLAVAMQQGHEKVVAVLLEADTRGRIRLPALHIAAKKDDVKAATLLLEVSNEHNPDVTSKSGFTPLHIAAHYGNEAIARLLLAKGADVNFPAKHNICPLHVAAKWGKENMVMLLLERGANVESRTRDGLTPLHCAARSGHERVIEQLLEKGAPITSKSKNGLAPLHMAAQGDHAPALKALLGRRAAVDEVTADYLTALHVAAHCGHVKAAKLLLERGADADARALNGFTPLHIACKKNRIKVVELLLKHGASISATTESGLTPLHVASFMGCMNIVIYLLQHDAPPDAATVRGETPLHLAARANQTDIIRILLRNGAAVEARARERQTPLHVAARLGHADNVLLLLQHGAAPDAAASDRCSALHLAAKHHNHDVAQVLIENGAPLTATTKKGFTPLHLAAKYGNLKVANLLLQHGAPPDAAGKNGVTPLHVAAQYDQQQVATVLLEKGANAKAAAKNGHTPLHIAARKNQMETAGTLLEYGALPNAESKAGFTPLHLAAQQGHNEMCSLLVEHEADPNSQAKNGLTSLHLAAQEDRVPVAGIIVKNGAKVDVCTQGGYTPLHVASHFGQTNMVRFLLDSGALVQTKTCHGYTALHHAAQQGHINIVSLLLERGAESNATTNNGQTALDIAQKLGYVTVVETLKSASEAPMSPTAATAPSVTTDKYKVVAPETMLETFMSDSEEEGGEDTILTDQPYRYLTADDMKSLGDDSLPIDVTRDERAESIIGTKSIMDTSQGSNGPPYVIDELHTAKNMNHLYNTEIMKEGYCYNVDGNQPKRKLQWKNFLVSFLVDARGGAMRGNRGGGVKVIVPPLSAQQPTRITCRYLKASRINHMPPLMEGEALASRVLELGPVSAKFLGPIILEVPHYASLRGKEREIVILRSDNGTNWREHTLEASDEVVQDILNDTLEIDDPNEDSSNNGYNRTTRILTHDFPQYFAVISRIRQEVHAIGPEGGMVSSSVVPQVQAVFPQGALTKKIKVGLQAQSIDPELTAKLFGRGVAVSPVVTVEPRRRKFHKAITLSMPAPRPHSQGMINQYTSSAPTLRLLCSISGGTNRAHWEDVTENTPLTFVNDCVSFTTTVSARYWLIDCRNVADATKMATELYREAIHVPFIARFVVYARRMEQLQAQLRVFCVTDDREDKTLEKMERFTQVAKSRDVEVHEGKPCYLEFAGNMVPIVKTGEQHFVPFRAFRENRLAFNVMIKSLHADAVGRCQFMREPKVAKGEPSQTPVCALNIVIPEEIIPEDQPISIQPYDQRDLHIVNKSLAVEEQETIRQQRLHDPSLSDICNLLGKDWVALAYELGVSTATINQIQARKLTAAQQAELMLKLWKTQGGNKAQDNSLELALCRIGRDDIIAPQSNVEIERRIQRNIYQERQGSEEIEGYKLKSDKDKAIDDDHRIAEREDGEGRSEMEEAKYSPEEKSYIGESTERDPSISPSDDSEDDEAIKKSVAERKMQITRKLSQSKVPASKQKKELREEIIEIKKQINPEIKKFHIQQSTVAQVEIPRDTSSERLKSRLSQDSDATTPKEVKEVIKEVEKEVEKEVIKEEIAEEKTDKSPPRPGPKYMQKHIRNDSTIRFSSGDYSDVKIPAQKSPKDTGKKEDDFNVKSPDVVSEDKDVAEASLKDKIKTFESKMDVTKTESVKVETKVKLTEEVLKRHTEIHDQATEYTKDFVRNQAIRPQSVEEPEYTMPKEEELAISPEIVMEEPTTPLLIKDQKMFKRFDRTDSTIVQFSSEDDSELLKKSTDSETETESQTTVRQQINKVEETISLEKKISKEKEEFAKKLIASAEQTCKDGDVFEKVEHSAVTSLRQAETGLRVDSSEDSLRVSSDEEMHAQADQMQTTSVGTTLTTSTKAQISDSISSDISKKSTSDALLDSKSPKLPLSGMEKADSLADLQQSTERDVSFISQTESKIYSKQTRSDSLDEASDLEDTQIPGAQKIPDLDMRKQTSQFIQWETQYASQDIAIKPPELPERKREDLSKVQLEEPRSDSLEESSELEDRRTLDSVRQQTADFLRWETQSSSEEYEVQPPDIPDRKVEDLKKEPVISAKARQFIETVPEDESVQECFFSKRIYSDSLEDSENHTSTDSRRASEPESLKSDRSDLSEHRTRPTSEFDELAELESAEIEGFGAKMYIPGSRTDSDDRDTSSGSSETRPRKVTKRHSRTESVSISQFSAADFKDEIAKATAAVQPEFQIIVTEAPDDERLSSFEKEELSDKISSESSREIEISDRKSSDDRISSEDAVTGKKSSSEEDIKKDEEKTPTAENIKDFKADSVTKKEIAISDTTFKRQSVTSTSSGTMDFGAAGKRPSDAHSLTESKDYTFEESEYSGGAHLAETKEKVEEHKEAVQIKAKDVVDPIIPTAAKSIPPKIFHGDSLDDVEAFPDDHIIEHVSKMPGILETSTSETTAAISSIVCKESTTITSTATSTTTKTTEKQESFVSDITLSTSVSLDQSSTPAEIIVEKTTKLIEKEAETSSKVAAVTTDAKVTTKASVHDESKRRTYSVQSSPDDVEEKICTDSESDKAKVLEIIEPTSDQDLPIYSFDPKKIQTDSLDDADDLFPESHGTESEDFYAEYSLKTLQKQSSKDAKLAAVSPKVDIAPPRIDITRSETEERSEDSYDIDFDKKQAASEAAEAEKKKKEDEKEEVATKNEETIAKKEEEATTKEEITIKEEVEAERKGEEAEKEEETSIKKYETKTGKYTPKDNADEDKEDERSPDFSPEEDREKILSEFKTLNRADRRCSDFLEEISQTQSQTQAQTQGSLVRIDTSHVARDLSLKFSKTPPPSPIDLVSKDKDKVEAGVEALGQQPKSPIDLTRASGSSAKDSKGSTPSDTASQQNVFLKEAAKALDAAAAPKSPTRHNADNLAFVNVDQPTLTSGAKELVDKTIEKGLSVVDKIKQEMSAVESERIQNQFQLISGVDVDVPKAQVSFSTVLMQKKSETHSKSGSESFTETRHVSSSDDDSLIVSKVEQTIEIKGVEHRKTEKESMVKIGDKTEFEKSTIEKGQEAAAKRSDTETKTTMKSSDDNDVTKVQREYQEQGLYAGRQTKSEERMSAIKDEIQTKKTEVKYSERDISHEQWGKEYFSEEGDDSYQESSVKVIEKDETIVKEDVLQDKGIVTTKTDHTKEESIVESKERDDLSSSSSTHTKQSDLLTDLSPKSRSKLFKKENEVYDVDFVKEIKVSTTRSASQESLSPLQQPQEPIQDHVWEVCLQQQDSLSETVSDLPLNQMAKSGESLKSLESHDAETMQKSLDSETLPEFSDSSKNKIKKEKSLEDICSSGYDTDLSSAEFQSKLESRSPQPFSDFSALEKTIDEVKQSLEAAQGEIINEKNDGTCKYKQSPSEFQFKLVSPDKPEVIQEEPTAVEEAPEEKKSFEISVSDQEIKVEVIEKDKDRDDDFMSDDDREVSQSGPHSLLETVTDVSESSPEAVRFRPVHKQIKSRIPVKSDRRSASDVEGWSSSGESHYQSFDSPKSRPLSSDADNLGHSTGEYESANTNQDMSSRSLRTSKEYYTAVSSLASRESMKSLDSESSGHLASIDISDASETLVPSASELKEELLESGNFSEQFEIERMESKASHVSDESPDEDVGDTGDADELVGKMKRSHEMRFGAMSESTDVETETIIEAKTEGILYSPRRAASPRVERTEIDLDSLNDDIISRDSLEYQRITQTESFAIGSKQSSTSSVKDQLSTPLTPISIPSHSSESTDNGREYVLDDMYEISEGPELFQTITDSKSEISVTMEERTIYETQDEKGHESPVSDEFEMVDKPGEIDDFVVIEEVAREATETDTEGKSVCIQKQTFEKKHDDDVERYLSQATKKDKEAAYSTSSSLSEDEMAAFEAEQKRLRVAENAEIEAGRKWIQMQFEGDARYDYERVPLEDIKEEEMTDFDASRIGSLTSQKESVGSYGSIKNSFGSLSESEILLRKRYAAKTGEQDDMSVSSLQEFENLEKALMEQYQQHSSSSQDSLNGSLPKRYHRSKSGQGDDLSMASLKEFEGLEHACVEALTIEMTAKQKEALLAQDCKESSASFLDLERKLYSTESSPPQKSGSPGQKSGKSSPGQKSSSSPSLKSGSPGQKYGSPSQRAIAEAAAIKKLVDEQMEAEKPKITYAVQKKYDDRGAFFVPEKAPEDKKECEEGICMKKTSYHCTDSDEAPGDCEEMMKQLEREELEAKRAADSPRKDIIGGRTIEVVRTTKTIQQKFKDGKKVSETVTEGVDIPGARAADDFESGSRRSLIESDLSSSITSQQSDTGSLVTMLERPMDYDSGPSSYERSTVTRTVVSTTRHVSSFDKPTDLDLKTTDVTIRELSPGSGKSVSQTTSATTTASGKCGDHSSWSGHEEDMSSSGSFSRGQKELMLGSTDSLEATSSNATRATYNYEVDTGSLTGSFTSAGSNTMVSSLDNMDPLTAFHIGEDGEQHFLEYEVQEADDSDTEKAPPRTKERTIMFESTETLSGLSGEHSSSFKSDDTILRADGSTTFFIGDTPIVKAAPGTSRDDPPRSLEGLHSLSSSLSPPKPSPVPAQRKSLTGLSPKPFILHEEPPKKDADKKDHSNV